MKSIEYVRRYGSRLLCGDLDAGIEMAQLLTSEANAEYACRNRRRNKTERLKKEILEKYNRKGNTIRDLFAREYHQNVLNEDWFRHVITVTGEPIGSEPHDVGTRHVYSPGIVCDNWV